MKRLVIVRAGPNSLHKKWASPDRTWKLAVSSFGAKEQSDFPESDYFDYYQGGKWDGIYALFSQNPCLLREFDCFWLPDDDIDATSEQIEAMFELFDKYELELGQPSLTPDSYFTHVTTLRNKFTKLRYTNFVELMVPLLSQSILRRVLPLFQHSKSGFGIDMFWSRLASDPRQKCAILDEVSVRHTRPVGSVLAKEINKQGSSSDRERQAMSEFIGYDLLGVHAINIKSLMPDNSFSGRLTSGVLQFVSHAPWPYKTHPWGVSEPNRWPRALRGLRIFGGSLFWTLVSKARLEPLGKEWECKLSRLELGRAIDSK